MSYSAHPATSCLAHRTLSAGRVRSSPPPVPTHLPPNEGRRLILPPTCERRCADAEWTVFRHEKPSAYLLRSESREPSEREWYPCPSDFAVKETGAKASSIVSGMSQDRLEARAVEDFSPSRRFGFLAIRARMSRRNFRGWPKSLMRRGSDFEGVPAIGTGLLSGGFWCATKTREQEAAKEDESSGADYLRFRG